MHRPMLALLAMVACGSCAAMPLLVNVRHDLVREGIFERNPAGDGETDDSPAIQAAIDHVAERGGGMVFVPPGTYRIAGVAIPAGVTLSGAGPERTIFRALHSSPMLLPTGGTLRGFTAYGTPTEEVSGAGWEITTEPGSGGTATCSHIIMVRDAEAVRIQNVHVMESRYDCLYVRGSRGLRVVNCRFDRAGRNIVSMVGNDEDFVFEACHFGSLWRLYHFDIEPAGGRWVRDGLFLGCTFDGTRAGERGSDTWGAMLILTAHEELESRDITIAGCVFHDISLRVNGVFPGVRLLGNVLDGHGPFFLRVETNPVGELRDAAIRDNTFLDGDEPAQRLRSGVTFTGSTVFAGNTPAPFNDVPLDEPATLQEAAEDRAGDQ
ncbi:MAG: glycosyl hydrolase family 28-related protein [Armatimonadota bacterium]|nr:glycosyl hydrolase family 28-related protein [Armatimonadota bacterium]